MHTSGYPCDSGTRWWHWPQSSLFPCQSALLHRSCVCEWASTWKAKDGEQGYWTTLSAYCNQVNWKDQSAAKKLLRVRKRKILLCYDVAVANNLVVSEITLRGCFINVIQFNYKTKGTCCLFSQSLNKCLWGFPGCQGIGETVSAFRLAEELGKLCGWTSMGSIEKAPLRHGLDQAERE